MKAPQNNPWKVINNDLRESLVDTRKRARETVSKIAYNVHSGIVRTFYTAVPGANIGMARRTGTAAKSWKVAISNGRTMVASVYSAGVPYADMSSEKIITPKKAKWLAIPVGPALTASGAPRYPGGPRQAAKALVMPPLKTQRGRELSWGATKARDPLSFVKKDANTAFLMAKPGVRGTGLTKGKRIMFVLKKRVKIPARTRLLMPWVDRKIDKAFDAMARGF